MLAAAGAACMAVSAGGVVIGCFAGSLEPLRVFVPGAGSVFGARRVSASSEITTIAKSPSATAQRRVGRVAGAG